MKDFLTRRERDYIEKVKASYGLRSFRAKQCYANAQRLIIGDVEHRLRYWEGMMDGSIPHAWVTINGKIVDVPEEAVRRKLRRERIGASDAPRRYAGVRVDRRRVSQHIARANMFEPVLGT